MTTPHKTKLLSPPWEDHGMTECPHCNLPLAGSPVPSAGAPSTSIPGGPYGGIFTPSTPSLCARGAACQAQVARLIAPGVPMCESDCPRCKEMVDEIDHDIDDNGDMYYTGSFSDGRVGEATKGQLRDLKARVDDALRAVDNLVRKLNLRP